MALDSCKASLGCPHILFKDGGGEGIVVWVDVVGLHQSMGRARCGGGPPPSSEASCNA